MKLTLAYMLREGDAFREAPRGQQPTLTGPGRTYTVTGIEGNIVQFVSGTGLAGSMLSTCEIWKLEA